MTKRATLLFTAALFLIGCSATARFSGAVKDAQQAGRPVLVYSVPRGIYDSHGYLRATVNFINIAAEPLKSVTFDLLPYRGYRPVPRAIKGFTAKGPFAPNQAYTFRGPRIDSRNRKYAWPKFNGLVDCVTVVGMTIKKANGKMIHVNEKEINQYVAPHVNAACVPRPGAGAT